MVVYPLTPHFESGELVIEARIEAEKPPYDLPPTLWFRFPESFAGLVSDCADGLALALVFIAMRRGEKLALRGTLSAQLAYGLQEYERIEVLRHPKVYHPIEITADGYTPALERGDKVACPFSGGVDSFYTLWGHLAQNEKFTGNALTHAVFMQGFDIGLDDAHSFETCAAAYRRLLADWKVELVTGSTNVRAFDRFTAWNANYKPALLGAAHLLRRGVRHFYVPAEYSFDESEFGIASALEFGLLSSESLVMMNDGADVNKFERITAIAHVPATFHTLRVCYEHPDGLANCGICGKCINTMIALEIAGTLSQYTTFSRTLSPRSIRAAHASYAALPLFMSTLRGAHACGRDDLARDMGIMLARNTLYWGTRWLGRRLHEFSGSGE